MGAVGLRTDDANVQNAALSGKSIKATAKDIVGRDRSNWEAHVFDKDGNDVMAFKGSEKGVYISEASKQVENGTLLYPHIGKYDWGGSASPSAIVEAFGDGSKLKTMMIPDRLGNMYTFTVKNEAARKQLVGLAKRIKTLTKNKKIESGPNAGLRKGNYQRSYESALRAAKKNGLDNTSAKAFAREIAIQQFDRAWTKLANSPKNKGFTYKKSKFKV